jgi:hypothetical protein
MADEDFMAAAAWAAGKNMDGCSEEECKELVRHYATHDENASELASESLLKHGTVAHRGPIPRSAITRIALVSATFMSALRYRDYKDESLWQILANPTPEDLTPTQQFQAQLTHQIFDQRHPEVRIPDHWTGCRNQATQGKGHEGNGGATAPVGSARPDFEKS